jgi:hypothetical protein
MLSFECDVRAQSAVRVQAQSSFDAVTRVASGDGVEIRGRLVDDTERPIASASIELEANVARLQGAPLDCKGQRPLRRRGERRPLRFALVTEADGTFCVRMPSASRSEDGALALVFAGDAFQLGARLTVPPVLPRITLALAFEAPSLELPLDRSEHTIRVRVTADPAPPASLRSAPLELSLATPTRETAIARADWLRDSASVEFSVDSQALGAPGPARLIARHRAGSGPLAPAQAQAVALRIAPVHLAAALERRDADGALIDVQSASVGGLSAPGWVEAYADGERLGGTILEQGHARLALELGASEQAITVELRYRGDDPWWVPGPRVELIVPPGKVAAPLRWPWLALLVPIGYLFVRALERPGFSTQPVAPSPPPLPVAEIELLEASPEASGWSGLVRDAHDSTPIAGANIAIVPAERDGQPSGPRAVSDSEGRFRLESIAIMPGTTLHVSAPAHSSLTRPLPPEGRIGVALVSRRRTIVRRLVDWARSAGAPWAGTSEPTPGEVLDVALRREEPRIAQWARSIEAAAFGRIAPDEQREAQLRALEPRSEEQGDRKR